MKTFYKFPSLCLCLGLSLLISCNIKESKIITVTGEIPASSMGKTLHHEHLLVDFIGADSTGYHRWNKAEVVEKALPYLLEIKKLGYKTLVECTPAYLGRDPELLKILAEKSGIQIITNTGYYSAVGGKYIPEHGFTETSEQLAERWIAETKNGIEGTGIHPGFIKISVERNPLEEINRKVVEAACITHKATGLVIMSHTGLAVPAFQQLGILKKYGVDPSAFIWTHAHNEQDFAKHTEAAKMGAWIAFDNFTPTQLGRYVEFALLMKKEGLLNKVLFSHDAGWYDPGKPEGGKFRGFTEIEELLIPALKKGGLEQKDINQLFIINPATAFQVQIRLSES
ncbi:MAG TPA: aryldialkylphosphatase [Prolixibacteraceae bacterium]|nr:aryldialkylphosphatase [Prolixibacteraceae bacterium]